MIVDGNQGVDLVSDLNDGTFDDTGGQGPAIQTDGADDIRSLLNKAMEAPGDDQGQGQGADTRQRGPDGKFIKADAAKPGEGQQPPADGQKPVNNDVNASQAPGSPVAAPATMPDAERAKFAELPPEMQQYVARMAGAYENAAAQLRGFDSIVQEVEQRKQGWAMQGMTPEGAVQHLFALSDFAGKDPAGFVQWFAGQHGLDLASVSDDGIQVDPNVQALHTEINNLKQQLGQFANGQQQQQHQSYTHEVTNWATEKDDKGVLARPYFDVVANDLMQIIPAIREQNPNLPPREVLNAAYERAVWANPQSRAMLLKAQEDAQEAQRLASAASRTNRASGAAVSVTNSPGEGKSTDMVAERRNLREELEYQFSQHS